MKGDFSPAYLQEAALNLPQAGSLAAPLAHTPGCAQVMDLPDHQLPDLHFLPSMHF